MVDVEAKVIDNELATLTKAEEWLAKASERVAERCELYRPPESITDEREYKDAKAARTQCRKDAAEIDNERKALLRTMEDALKKFKSEVKDVLSPLTDLDVQYKELLDSYEELCKTNRYIELSTEYEELFPDLVPLVPFERLIEKFGNERGFVWLNRSTNIMAAKGLMGEAVAKIADAETSLARMVDEEELAEVKAIYFQTLDLQTALAEANRLKEQRLRVLELERVRKEREMMYAPAPEPEPEPQPVQTYEQPTPPPAPEITCPWVVVISAATRKQMTALAQQIKSMGISSGCIYAGTISDAYRKEQG